MAFLLQVAWIPFVVGYTTVALAGCTVEPGFDFADFELGNRAELRARYKQHTEC